MPSLLRLSTALAIVFLGSSSWLNGLEIEVPSETRSIVLPPTFAAQHGSIGTWGAESARRRFSGADPALPLLEPTRFLSVAPGGRVTDFKVSSHGEYAFFSVLGQGESPAAIVRVTLATGEITAWKLGISPVFEPGPQGFGVFESDGTLLLAVGDDGEVRYPNTADLAASQTTRIVITNLPGRAWPSPSDDVGFVVPSPLDPRVKWTLRERPTGWQSLRLSPVRPLARVKSAAQGLMAVTDGRNALHVLNAEGQILSYAFALPPEYQDPTRVLAFPTEMTISAEGTLYLPYGSLGGREDDFLSGVLPIVLASGIPRPFLYLRSHVNNVRFVDFTAEGTLVAATYEALFSHEERDDPRVEVLVYGSNRSP